MASHARCQWLDCVPKDWLLKPVAQAEVAPGSYDPPEGAQMARLRSGRVALALAGVLVLASCVDESGSARLQTPDTIVSGTLAPLRSTRLVERDIEAPDVFQVSDQGLWDGRPSLGGVWVAYDTVTTPERVIIRNSANGKFVIGALFRREVHNPGPALQVSSDAAAALGMLAGAPAALNVTALRREEVPQDRAPAAGLDSAEVIENNAPEPLEEAAAAAIASATSTAPAPTRTTASAAAASELTRPSVQIGIFSVEANAIRTADQLRKAGIVPGIKLGNSAGKAFWRVVIGPASSVAERDTLIKTAKGLGYTDAYAVTH
jgi:cell division septation protein DedD